MDLFLLCNYLFYGNPIYVTYLINNIQNQLQTIKKKLN